jgi:DNA-binding CsgD family transcriptional regulator
MHCAEAVCSALSIFYKYFKFTIYKLISQLTKQEYCVLDLLGQGLSVKSVAQRLDLSLHTVNGHMKLIYFKLNVKSRGQAQHLLNEYLSVNSNKLITTQEAEKAERAAELVIANTEKAERAADLVIANIELDYQKQEKAKRVDELVIADAEKAERAVELAIANIELDYQKQEKSKRADELQIANAEKAERAAELVIANAEKAVRKYS